jgi:hypothetical protein
MANPLLADELSNNGHSNGIGLKQFEPAKDLSIQRRATQETAGVYSFWFSRPLDDSEIAPYWSQQRDRDLRRFCLREGNDILQGALSSMNKWAKTLSWVVEGPERVAKRNQAMLAESEFGDGWGTLVSKGYFDYTTQDKGWTMEVIGAGDPDGPIDGPVLGLAHLDSQFVMPTGDVTYPVIFTNRKDNSYHKIHTSRVVRIVDMPSPNELLFGVGFCALSRLISTSQVLHKLARYKNEKLSDMPEAGLLILNNILPRQFDDAIANSERGRRKLGQEIWSNIMTLFSIDPAQPAEAKFLSFANLPDGFKEAESVDLYVNVVALVFGVDRSEFFPAAIGNFGSGQTGHLSAEKARGKGKGDYIASIERAINWKVLPESVSFKIDNRDDEQDRLKAEINGKKVESIMSMWMPDQVANGVQPPISAIELRQMLADNVPDYFKPDFLEMDITDEEELTDIEREVNKQFGPIVWIDQKGYKKVTGNRRMGRHIDNILEMAEENYKAGKCSLDDLIEFRLGKVLDERG